ncbi:hypothetical protein BDW74DRAFT_19577 [Aspergillus multicolor]|uniref:uncharacterized protein n=1 Tax=Aspergillus multicolor TaxID=41759 RepID=UPI003CCD5589
MIAPSLTSRVISCLVPFSPFGALAAPSPGHSHNPASASTVSSHDVFSPSLKVFCLFSSSSSLSSALRAWFRYTWGRPSLSVIYLRMRNQAKELPLLAPENWGSRPLEPGYSPH